MGIICTRGIPTFAKRTLIGLALVIGTVFLLMKDKIQPLSRNVVGQQDTAQLQNGTKVILFWTRVFGEPGQVRQPSVYVDPAGVTHHCLLTTDRSLHAHAHALIFHVRDSFSPLPPVRLPHQRYVFYLMESQPYTQADLTAWGGFFNWTMTHRWDSDVRAPYGVIVSKAASSDESQELDARRRVVAGKTKMAAWFVSSCHTPSQREKYVRRLAEFMPVDIYGACGTHHCPKSSTSDCHKMLESDYMFYLSFENSYCTDYVTEKLYGILGLNIVPVVFGRGDYTRDAPPHAVVDVGDFEGPEQLASYLKYLSSNTSAYMEYLAWKRRYTVAAETPFSTLCKLLHTRSETKVYSSIYHWWFDDQCKNPPFGLD